MYIELIFDPTTIEIYTALTNWQRTTTAFNTTIEKLKFSYFFMVRFTESHTVNLAVTHVT